MLNIPTMIRIKQKKKKTDKCFFKILQVVLYSIAGPLRLSCNSVYRRYTCRNGGRQRLKLSRAST